MSTVRIVLIVACLVADMATPLCPGGAFRFDPAESIDAVGARAIVAPVRHVDAASPPVPGVPEARWVPSPRPALTGLIGQRRIRSTLPRAALASIRSGLGSPRLAEDG
jgi:hypothetical protein